MATTHKTPIPMLPLLGLSTSSRTVRKISLMPRVAPRKYFPVHDVKLYANEWAKSTNIEEGDSSRPREPHFVHPDTSFLSPPSCGTISADMLKFPSLPYPTLKYSGVISAEKSRMRKIPMRPYLPLEREGDSEELFQKKQHGQLAQLPSLSKFVSTSTMSQVLNGAFMLPQKASLSPLTTFPNNEVRKDSIRVRKLAATDTTPSQKRRKIGWNARCA